MVMLGRSLHMQRSTGGQGANGGRAPAALLALVALALPGGVTPDHPIGSYRGTLTGWLRRPRLPEAGVGHGRPRRRGRQRSATCCH